MAITQVRTAGEQVTGEHLTDVLDAALTDLDADESSGATLRAAGLRVLLEMADVSCTLNLESVDSGDHHIRWGFGGGESWSPRLRISCAGDVANRWLQGRENLIIALARGRVRVEGDPRFTLHYVPVLRLLVPPYRRAVAAVCPGMTVD